MGNASGYIALFSLKTGCYYKRIQIRNKSGHTAWVSFGFDGRNPRQVGLTC